MLVFLKGDDKREVLSKDAQQKELDSLRNFAWRNCDDSRADNSLTKDWYAKQR